MQFSLLSSLFPLKQWIQELSDSSHEYSSVYGRRYKSTVAFTMNILHFEDDVTCMATGNRLAFFKSGLTVWYILKCHLTMIGILMICSAQTISASFVLYDHWSMYFVTVSTSSITWPRWASTSIWSFNEWPPIWRTQTSSSSSPSSASFGCSNWPDTPQDSRSSFKPLEPRPRSSCFSSSS